MNIKTNNINKGEDILEVLVNTKKKWIPPVILDAKAIPTGDMPGDKIEIRQKHIEKANMIFPELLRMLCVTFEKEGYRKAVVSVYGGSGVGKSEIGSLLSYYLNELNIGSYVISGDNYPRRMPAHNDAERLRVFRDSGLEGLEKTEYINQSTRDQLAVLWNEEIDSDKNLTNKYPWLSIYQEEGQKGLVDYLGSIKEINFEEINRIIEDFKAGEKEISLKRMGREQDDLWYEAIDFSNIDVFFIEWTHGNNSNLKGVDLPILLNSTPEETLEHRRSRNRDGKIDSAFTTLILHLEQRMLMAQAKKSAIIVTKSGNLITYGELIELTEQVSLADNGPMLNSYPDSIGFKLEDTLNLIVNSELKDCFDSYYILPSIYNTDLDRGFSVIDYDINEVIASKDDLKKLQDMNINLKLDFILNHASVLSPQFQDIIAHGKNSKYLDFFINWNEFWEDYGKKNEQGVVIPEDKYIKNMFFRKPGLPILNVHFPDGADVPYWNTFYQEIKYDLINAQDVMSFLDIKHDEASSIAEIVNRGIENNIKPYDIVLGFFESYKKDMVKFLESKRKYLGQMDLNINSPLVWEFYNDVLKKLKSYGAAIVRLDAFAYAAKSPGKHNFFNEPDTWELLAKIKNIADKYNLKLLPEIHTRYEEGMHLKVAEQGYMLYDFFLPGLLIDAIERQSAVVLKKWIDEIIAKGIKTVNMLGCHDGIPLLDLKGLLNESQIQNIIEKVVSRGGLVKDLHGKKNMYYQVNATYYSALGEDKQRLIFARAIQMFMPGKPQIWYLDLLAGTNDYKAVTRSGAGGHKEINRTNLSLEETKSRIKTDIVQEQIKLLKLRKTHPAFKEGAIIDVENPEDDVLKICWQNDEYKLIIDANFRDCTYFIKDLVSGKIIQKSEL